MVNEDCSQRGALAVQVVEGKWVFLDEWGQQVFALLVVSIDVRDRRWVEDLGVNQLAAVWSDRQVLPAVVISKGGMLSAENDVLNPDSELAILVVSWLVRDAHACEQLGVVCATDTTWALVHVQVVADSMTSTMLVVEPDRPEASTRQDVHVCARNGEVRWPDDALDVQSTKQHAGVSLLLEVRGRLAAKVNGSCDVSRAVQVLTT